MVNTKWASGEEVYFLYNKTSLEQIQNCTTFHRSIYIGYQSDQNSWRDNDTGVNDTTLDFGAITHIKGDLMLKASYLAYETILAKNLKQVDGSLIIEHSKFLEEINMPALISVGQSYSTDGRFAFNLIALPMLQNATFSSEGVIVSFPINVTAVRAVEIQKTALRKVDFLRSDNMPADNLDEIFILDNPQLSEINLPGLTGGVGNLEIRANSPNLKVTMAKLQSGRDFAISNVESLSLPELQDVAGAFKLINNNLTSLNFQRLRLVRNELEISENLVLNEVRLNNLAVLGDSNGKPAPGSSLPYGNLRMDNNPKLRLVLLDVLEKVSGSLRISGIFDRYVTLWKP